MSRPISGLLCRLRATGRSPLVAARDGEQLLALFVHPDGKRWILWTPQGYYDASAGAEDLIGWQVNHGLDQAPDFFSGVALSLLLLSARCDLKSAEHTRCQ